MPLNTSFGGSIPESYDRYLGPFLFEPYAKDLVERIKNLNVTNVLEIASGTGRVTRHIRTSFPTTVKITATDINPDMLKIAKQNVENNNVEFRIADAQDLPFESETFDLVVCQFGYMFVPDKPKAFSEAYRVLKKGGILFFNTWDKLANNDVINTVNGIVTEFFENSPPQFYAIPFSMHKKQELSQLPKSAGFSDVTVTKVKKEGSSHSALEVVKGFIEGNPIINEITEKDPTAPPILISKAEKAVMKSYGIYAKSKLSAWIVKAVK